MRRAMLALSLILAVIFLSLPSKAIGQTSVQTLNPQVYNFELSGKEPAPPGVDDQLGWGDMGAGCCIEPDSQQPEWEDLSGVEPLSYPFLACGFRSEPVATLILPDNQSKFLTGRNGQDGHSCWYYEVNPAYGMELGQYTLRLDSLNGSLTRTWTINYARGPTYTYIDYSGKPALLLMGLTPNQTITIHFYANRDFGVGDHIATRTFRPDNNGAALLNLVLTHSFPYPSDRIGFTVDNLGITKGVVDSRIILKPCVGPPEMRLHPGGQARVTPGQPNRLNDRPVRSSEGAQQLALVPAGSMVTVNFDVGPECDGDIQFWPITYNGISGWMGEGQGSDYWLEPVVN